MAGAKSRRGGASRARSSKKAISAPAIAAPAPAADVARPQARSDYMKGGSSPFFWGWLPHLRSEKESVIKDYERAAARAIDSLHNSGYLAGGCDQATGHIIGNGLRLAAKPDVATLGWDQTKADTWSKLVETRWETWCRTPVECDVRGQQEFGALQHAAMASYWSHGEILALLPRINRVSVGGYSRIKVKVLPAHRLLQDCDPYTNVHQGIQMDKWGMPTGYKLDLNPGIAQPTWIAARNGGQRQVVHCFKGLADQVRGITPLVNALRTTRQFDQLSDGTLTALLMQTLLAATIKSTAPTADLLRAIQDDSEQGIGGSNLTQWLSSKGEWYDGTNFDLGRPGKVVHLFPNEELDLKTAQTPGDNYEAFANFLLREIARGLGITFEALTGDYRGATYSSVRMATAENWPLVVYRRHFIAAPFCQAVYEGWLEEEIENDRIPFDGGILGFYEKQAAACRSEWRGPARPQADDLKAAKAYEVYKQLGIMSDERICAELGFDWQDEYEQRAKEKAERERLDLPELKTMEPDPVEIAELTKPDNTPAGAD